MNPHYFFAAVIPDHVKEAIFKEMKTRQYPFKRFTHPDDYHLTLAFIGAAEENALLEACHKIEETMRTIPSFLIRPLSFGTFGSKKAPRVFWVGTDEPKPLFRVEEKVADACRQSGLSIDEKPFRPHITTARQWKDPNHPYQEKEAPSLPAFYLNEIALYETDPLHQPRYKKKWACQLKNPGEENVDGTID